MAVYTFNIYVNLGRVDRARTMGEAQLIRDIWKSGGRALTSDRVSWDLKVTSQWQVWPLMLCMHTAAGCRFGRDTLLLFLLKVSGGTGWYRCSLKLFFQPRFCIHVIYRLWFDLDPGKNVVGDKTMNPCVLHRNMCGKWDKNDPFTFFFHCFNNASVFLAFVTIGWTVLTQFFANFIFHYHFLCNRGWSIEVNIKIIVFLYESHLVYMKKNLIWDVAKYKFSRLI